MMRSILLLIFLSLGCSVAAAQTNNLYSNIPDQVITGGANVVTLTLSPGNVTIDCGARPIQSIVNQGSFTITAPANDGTCLLFVLNNPTAGTITFSGFLIGPNTGDPLDNTFGHKFTLFIWRVGGFTTYRVAAHQ